MSESTPQISPEIRKQMESICRRAVAGRDDASRIGDELFGHLEDKLLAYLRGDERLTEADAMILVREHFGKPETLRSILRDVHETDAPTDGIPLIRKLLALSAAAAGIGLFVWILRLLVESVLTIFFTSPNAVSNVLQVHGGADIATPWIVIWHWRSFTLLACVSTGLFWLVVRRIRISDKPVESRWYVRWHPALIAAGIVATMVARLIPSRLYGRVLAMISPVYWSWGYQDTSQIVNWSLTIITAGMMSLTCLIWMNWAGDRRLLTRAGLIGAAAWAAFNVLADYVPALVSWALGGQPLTLYADVPLFMLAAYFSVAAGVVGLVAAWHAVRWAGDRIRIRVAWASQPSGS